MELTWPHKTNSILISRRVKIISKKAILNFTCENHNHSYNMTVRFIFVFYLWKKKKALVYNAPLCTIGKESVNKDLENVPVNTEFLSYEDCKPFLLIWYCELLCPLKLRLNVHTLTQTKICETLLVYYCGLKNFQVSLRNEKERFGMNSSGSG
jgi:hypothetical protein